MSINNLPDQVNLNYFQSTVALFGDLLMLVLNVRNMVVRIHNRHQDKAIKRLFIITGIRSFGAPGNRPGPVPFRRKE